MSGEVAGPAALVGGKRATARVGVEVSTATVILKVVLTVLFVYVFLVSIRTMSTAFGLLGEGFASAIIHGAANPWVGLFAGILATSLVQSSSAVTSIVVAAGQSGVLPLASAVPVVMGANIGTSVTNILVSLSMATRRREFRLALGGALVHDLFNVLCVALFFPIEVFTRFFSEAARWIAHQFHSFGGVHLHDLVGVVVKPVAEGLTTLVRVVVPGTGVHEAIVLGVVALAFLFGSLVMVVKVMRGFVVKRLESLLGRYLFRNALISFGFGILLTAAVQSSSVTTSIVVPLVGAGVLTIGQIYPYTLGANIGTTITAGLASFARAGATGSTVGVAIAVAHLLFNVAGCCVWYPLRRVPIRLAKNIARETAKHKWLVVMYMALVFFAIPIVMIFLTR